MITRTLPLQFLKKSAFFGSCEKMRYRFCKEGEDLQLCIYPGPFSYDNTPEDVKQFHTFPFTEDGYEEAIAFLNRVYEETVWEEVPQPVF